MTTLALAIVPWSSESDSGRPMVVLLHGHRGGLALVDVRSASWGWRWGVQ